MKLYSYWRSTTSYRIRIALHEKGFAFETEFVGLVAGEQSRDDYLAISPAGDVPSLVLNDGITIIQSMAILDYLEQLHPEPSLLPSDPLPYFEAAHSESQPDAN